MEYLGRAFGRSLPIIVAFTIVLGFGYLAGQSVYRHDVEDPLVQITRDVAARLNRGASPDEIVQSTGDMPLFVGIDETWSTWDVGTVTPFVVIYDSDSTPLAWSATIDGGPARPPEPFLEQARLRSEYRGTWDNDYWVRIAAVAVDAGDYVVMAGRSLDEYEAAIASLQGLALTAWLLGVAGIAAASYLAESRSGTLESVVVGALREAPGEKIEPSDLRSFTHH